MRRHAMASSAGPISSTGGFGALWRIASVCALVTTALLASSASAVAAECPNEQLRRENNSLNLPDCRAYEQVSPQDKNGTDVLMTHDETVTAPDGNATTFASVGAFAGTSSSNKTVVYMSRRGASGWTTRGVLGQTNSGIPTGARVLGFSPDLSQIFTSSVGPVLAPGATPETINYYLESGYGPEFGLVSPGPGTLIGEAELAGWSKDSSSFAFTTNEALTPGAASGWEAPGIWRVPNVYEWQDGHLSLVGVLPNGSAPEGGSYAGPMPATGNGSRGIPYAAGAISSDGSRVSFTDLGTGQLYLRENGTTTVAVSESQRTPPDPAGPQPAQWLGASADGSAVFFASAEKLTNDSNALVEPGGGTQKDLYRYDANTRKLIDLTAGPEPADVQGVLGVSEDGEYVYYAAMAKLAEGAEAGAPNVATNVYLWHDGTTSFVARLSLEPGSLDEGNWQPTNLGASGFGKTSRMTPDGQTLLIGSTSQLTSYDNAGHLELYRYEASTGRLGCVSCNPRVQKATGNSGLSLVPRIAGVWIGPVLSHALTDDGRRVFFESEESLSPDDTNGKIDVYEWADGHINLISSGQSPYDSSFSDASPDGTDVFFVTRDKVLPADTDNNNDLYDARIGGGYPDPSPAPPCEAADCRAPGQEAPVAAPLASATFAGAGNLSPRRKTPSQLRAERLHRALKTCRRKPRRQRKHCEASARKRYETKAKAKKSNRRSK